MTSAAETASEDSCTKRVMRAPAGTRPSNWLSWGRRSDCRDFSRLVSASSSPESACSRSESRLASALRVDAHMLYAPSTASTTARKHTTANRTNDRSIVASLESDDALHRREHRLGQFDPARHKPVPEAWPHAGGGEVALHRA